MTIPVLRRTTWTAALPLDPYDPAKWPLTRAAEDRVQAIGREVAYGRDGDDLQVTLPDLERPWLDQHQVTLPLPAYLDAPLDVRDWMLAEAIGRLAELLEADRG